MNTLDCADTLADFEQLPTPSVYEVDPNEIRIRRNLPFGSLDRHQLRKLLYLPVELGSRDFGRRQISFRSIPKGQLLSVNLLCTRHIADLANDVGNYIASATMAELRIRQVRLNPRPRSLETVLELPHELVCEVNFSWFLSNVL
jgi:hypothetical protein